MGSDIPKVNFRVGERNFKYYIFDWDDNILHMPTRIHLERRRKDGTWIPHSVSTSLFTLVRNDHDNYRPPHGIWDEAFVEFRDTADLSESKFLTDTRDSLQKVKTGAIAPGPSFEKMRETLREGRIFAIVTARGHNPETLRQAVKMFIDVVLTDEEREMMMSNLRGYRFYFDKIRKFGTDQEELDYYLSLNKYHAVTNPRFQEWMEAKGAISSEENAKQFAIRDFVEHVIHIIERTGADSLKRPISVGFSDDDPKNVEAVTTYIRQELSRRFPAIKYCIYDTSDPTIKNGQKVVVSVPNDCNSEVDTKKTSK